MIILVNFGRDPDRARLVDDEHADEDAHGRGERLDADSFVALDALEDAGDAAEHDALGKAVGEDQTRVARSLEDDDQRAARGRRSSPARPAPRR